MEIVKGNLITMAKAGMFEVIAHGCNCFNTQGAGIALQMKHAFGTDTFPKEREIYKGDYNKLGTIDYEILPTDEAGQSFLIKGKKTLPLMMYDMLQQHEAKIEGFAVVNAYTQYNLGKDARPVWLMSVLMKLNHTFKGKRIGLPYIGAGIGGLNPNKVEDLILGYLKDCEVTLVEYEGNS